MKKKTKKPAPEKPRPSPEAEKDDLYHPNSFLAVL
jgi:hypothetical protein